MVTPGGKAAELGFGPARFQRRIHDADEAEHGDGRDPPGAVEAELHDWESFGPVGGDPAVNQLVDGTPADPQPLSGLGHGEGEGEPWRKR